MKSLGASAGSVRPQQQPHQLDPRARPPTHSTAAARAASKPAAQVRAVTTARTPSPDAAGTGHDWPASRIQQTRPRRGARPAMSPDDPQTRPPALTCPSRRDADTSAPAAHRR